VTDRSTADRFRWADAEHLWPIRQGVGLLRLPVDWHLVMRRAGTVDVVHAHGHQAAVIAAVAVLRARPRPRLVVSLHNDLPPSARSGPGARAVAWALRRADLVTGASADLVDLARSLGARQAEVATVTSPHLADLLDGPPATGAGHDALRASLIASVDSESGSVSGDRTDGGGAERNGPGTSTTGGPDETGRPLVLTVSRIAPQKDLHTLVGAARASGRDATWVVVGEGDAALRADLEKEAHGIRLHFVGARVDVEDWLRAADVFVLTSRWEARALVVQEAMAAGLPVVVPRTGGLTDLVGDAGVVVPPGDPQAVAAAVDGLLGDPDRRRRLGQLARARAATWDDPEAEARRWVERYTSLLGG
jgi:glycosyltransferase involved in cell wall biosynthesis